MSHGERNGDMGPRPGLEDLPLPPWASVSNFSIFWINLVSFPEGAPQRETSGSYMSGSSMAGAEVGEGVMNQPLQFQKADFTLMSKLLDSPPYSISVESSLVCFWLVNLWWVRSTWIALQSSVFHWLFLFAVVGDRWSVTLGYKTQERGGGCFGRHTFSQGGAPAHQLTAAFRSQIINNKHLAFRSQGNK